MPPTTASTRIYNLRIYAMNTVAWNDSARPEVTPREAIGAGKAGKGMTCRIELHGSVAAVGNKHAVDQRQFRHAVVTIVSRQGELRDRIQLHLHGHDLTGRGIDARNAGRAKTIAASQQVDQAQRLDSLPLDLTDKSGCVADGSGLEARAAYHRATQIDACRLTLFQLHFTCRSGGGCGRIGAAPQSFPGKRATSYRLPCLLLRRTRCRGR